MESDMVIDNYEHFSSNVVYIDSNVPGPGSDESLFQECYTGCQCLNSCSSEDLCSCLKQSLQRYNEVGNFSFPVDGNSMLIECGSECVCDSNCSNRIVQSGPIDGLRVFETTGKGLGLKTDKTITKGTFVCEYAGEVIGESEAKVRLEKIAESGRSCYLLLLREHFQTNLIETWIDAEKFANIGHYLNHSCDPNLASTSVRFGSPLPHVALFALRDIPPNEELTYHYGGGHTVDSTVKKKCLCLSVNCTGFLPDIV